MLRKSLSIASVACLSLAGCGGDDDPITGSNELLRLQAFTTSTAEGPSPLSTYQYDSEGYLLSIIRTVGEDEIFRLSYQYADGEAFRRDSDFGDDGVVDEYRLYEYDDFGRFLGFIVYNADDIPTLIQENLITESGVVTGWEQRVPDTGDLVPMLSSGTLSLIGTHAFENGQIVRTDTDNIPLGDVDVFTSYQYDGRGVRTSFTTTNVLDNSTESSIYQYEEGDCMVSIFGGNFNWACVAVTQ